MDVILEIHVPKKILRENSQTKDNLGMDLTIM